MGRGTRNAQTLARRAQEIPGLFNRVLYKNVRWQDEYGQTVFRQDSSATPKDAEVVSSQLVGTNAHAPVLDFDVPAYLVPSSTPGHSHLYIDHAMSWRQYKRLLRALAAAGVLEKGYVKASIRRGHTAVRVPWLKKPKRYTAAEFDATDDD